MTRGSFFGVVFLFLSAAVSLPVQGQTAPPGPLAGLDALYPEIEKLYLDLHQTPELSFQEEKTSAKMAARLKAAGFEVTTGVGGYGVVGVLRNGTGPTVMLRTELDALPVEERTGLPYASTVKVKDPSGASVPVMHACGHDVHMSVWSGAAALLSRSRDRWKGTLVFIGQPAEERGGGARAMLADGLFTRFPKPDFVVALHDRDELPAGKVGVTPGPAYAHVDSVDLVIYGRGGHGAAPHKTVDPIVIAARTVVALQTIVSREIDPTDPAVVTVGSIHGGTKHNIIPSEVRLQLTVRCYKNEVRRHLLAAIERIARAEAAAAGAPKPPAMTLSDESPTTVNDPTLTRRLAATFVRRFGEVNVVEMPPAMVSEDFSEYGLAGVPATIFSLGAVEPVKLEEARAKGLPLPSLHSGEWAPDRERTLKTGISALTAAALELLGKP